MTPSRPHRHAPITRIHAALVVALALGLVPTLAWAPEAPAQAAPSVIKLATLVPDGSVWDQSLKQAGAEWSRDTAGRVSLRVYPGGVAGSEEDVIRKMRIGQLQAAAVTVAGLAQIDPAFKVFTIPMFFDSYPELRAVLDKMTPMLKQRLDEKGFVLLNWGHGGWVHVFAKQPVSSVGDLKKLRLWVGVGDDRISQLWKKNGFQPVAVSTTDILSGLQSGMLDAIYITPLAALSLQWFRTTPYMSEIGLAPLVGGTIITKSAWSKLSAADQQAITASCHKLELQLEAQVPKQDSTSVAEMQKRGLKVAPVSPAQATEWRQTAETFAAQMHGEVVPADVMDLARRERDAWRSGAGRH
ncbi:MAG: TRAP transporter substrate-binding protein DctP [Candidatus Eisenbacteria bacterium]